MRSRMLLQVHDELVFETDEEELPVLAALADEVMEGALPLDPPLEVALKVGTDWETMDRYVREAETWRRVPQDGGRRGARGGRKRSPPSSSPRACRRRAANQSVSRRGGVRPLARQRLVTSTLGIPAWWGFLPVRGARAA